MDEFVLPLFHKNEYGEVPPETLLEILPLLLPQEGLREVNETINDAGCVITLLVVAVQLLASLTVTIYVPEVKPDKFWFVAPLDQTNVKGDVPDDTVMLIEPLFPPLHETLLNPLTDTTGPAALAIVTVPVIVQELASVTVTV